MRVEVRATGLRAMRLGRGLTQRQLGRDLGISQNYVPAIEANARQAGPRLQQEMARYFGCRFEDLFEVVLIDPEYWSRADTSPELNLKLMDLIFADDAAQKSSSGPDRWGQPKGG